MKLTTIGTGTGVPHATRVCAGHLVQVDGATILFDCGSGVVHRMGTLGIQWSAITHVAITHFHADHIADLCMLIFAWRWGQLPPRDEPVVIIGPAGIRSLMERLSAAFGAWVLDPGYAVDIREIATGETIAVGGATLSSFPVPHTPESVAYSIVEGDRRLVYTGDLGFSEAVARWAHSASLLLTECSLPDDMAIREHLTPRQAGAFAQIAQPSQLVLTHFYPPVEIIDVISQVAEHFAGPVALATDGWFIEL